MNPRSDQATQQSDEQQRGAVSYLWLGLHFGILQTAAFFAVQVYVTETYWGYFAVVVAWMAGVVFNLRVGRPQGLQSALLVSAAGYFALLFLTTRTAPVTWVMIVCAALVAVMAQPAGAFFRLESRHCTATRLFWHENNGFVLGYLLGLFCFLKWGVVFLAWGPVVSFFLAYSAADMVLLLAAGIVLSALTYGSGNRGAAVVLTIAVVISWLLAWLESKPRSEAVSAAPRNAERGLGRVERNLVLALAGGNLILLQYAITREFSTVLSACELAIILVATAYFIGFSVGYGLAHWLSVRVAGALSALAFFAHLALLPVIKVIGGYLIARGMGWVVLAGVVVLTAFCMSAVYSVFLPRLIDDAGGDSLAEAYSWDLCGAAVGVMAAMAAVQWAPAAFLPLYFSALAVLVLLVNRRAAWMPSFALLAAGCLALLVRYQAPLARYATEDYYQLRGYDNPKLLYSRTSFYHTTDVIATHYDSARTRRRAQASFINGVRYFQYECDATGQFRRGTGLSEFTYYLAALPARCLQRQLGRKLRVLILGAGSMYSLYRVKDCSAHTTMVEIDRFVVESAKRHWSEFNHWREVDNAEVIIDDAKRYLMTTDETFDLIVMDISAPYYLGTLLLHNKDFFKLVRSRLRSDGVFAESTQSRPRPSRPDSQAMKILRAVTDVFPNYRVLDCWGDSRGKHGYVFCSVQRQFKTADLVAIMKEDGMYGGTSIYDERSRHFRLQETEPFSLTSMETLLTSNMGRVKRRLKLTGSSGGVRAQGLLASMRLPAAIARELVTTPLLSSWALVLALAFGLWRWQARRAVSAVEHEGTTA